MAQSSSARGRLIDFELPPGSRRRPERIEEVLTELGKYWRAAPDLRLGQILDGFADSLARARGYTATAGAARALEDDALLGMLHTDVPHPIGAAHRYLADADEDGPLLMQPPPWLTAKPESPKPRRISFGWLKNR